MEGNNAKDEDDDGNDLHSDSNVDDDAKTEDVASFQCIIVYKLNSNIFLLKIQKIESSNEFGLFALQLP